MDGVGQKECRAPRKHPVSLKELIATATNKANFKALVDYIQFCQRYLDFIATGLQAVIVSQNEPNYHFFQYGKTETIISLAP